MALLQRVTPSVPYRDRARQRLEVRAREQGLSRVTTDLVRDLKEEALRWGWGGALSEPRSDPRSRPYDASGWRNLGAYTGFSTPFTPGAKDAAEAARQLSAQQKTGPLESIIDSYVEVLELQPGAQVLDLGCGQGRVAVPLARRGFAVTGVDPSRDWLAAARTWAELEGVDTRFIEADVRSLSEEAFGAEAEFDAVLSIGTLFQTAVGFPECREEAERLLDRVSRALKPGGRCLITDFPHVEGVLGSFQQAPSGTAVLSFWFEPEPEVFKLVEHRFRSAEARMYLRSLTIERDGVRAESRATIPVFTLSELGAMLEGAGLVLEQKWSAQGWGAPHTEYSTDRPEVAILSQKKP